MIISREEGLLIRSMRDEEADYVLLSRWLSDPRVLEYYEGRDKPFSLAAVKAKFSPRVLGRESVAPCILEDEEGPLGYIQYYPTDRAEYQVDKRAGMEAFQNIYALDLFIGVPEKWGKGLGTKAVRLLLDFLFGEKGAEAVYIDPKAENVRAAACYQKCGFIPLYVEKERELHEGKKHDSLIMRVTREERAGGRKEA